MYLYLAITSLPIPDILRYEAVSLQLILEPVSIHFWWGILFALATSKTIRVHADSLGVKKEPMDPIFALDSEIQHLKNRIQELQLMINSSKEGFLLVNQLYQIVPPFSHECYRIFNQEVLGESVCKLLANGDPKLKSFMEDSLDAIFTIPADNPMVQTYIGLLPKELQINGFIFEIRYSRVSEEHLMVVLVDVTSRRKFEAALKQEHNQLEFVVNALVNRPDFLELYHNYSAFINRPIFSLIASKQGITESIYELYRQIHTFKGLLFQSHFPKSPELLQKLEDQLSELTQKQQVVYEDLEKCVRHFPLKATFDHDLNIIRNHINEDFFCEQNKLSIPEPLIQKLESLAKAHLSTEHPLLKPLLFLRAKKVSEYLEPHFRAAKYLAEKSEKEVALHFEGEDLYLQPDKYKSLFMSFTHLFRNAIDHGLETKDERKLSAKSECGNIRLKVERDADWLVIKVKDDGRGIDLGAVEQKARTKELVNAERLLQMREEDLMMLIFENGFSSLDNCSSYSGRGVGLSAVREEVEKLGGSIGVKSYFGTFTQFSIRIPLYSVEVE